MTLVPLRTYLMRLSQVVVHGRLTGFDFKQGCLYLELEQEPKMPGFPRIHVRHFVNMTAARMAVEYANIRYFFAPRRVIPCVNLETARECSSK